MTHLRIFALTVIGVCVSAATASADIIITLTQSGTGVIASWTGSGTVVLDGLGPGRTLNFNNFSGTPFVSGGPTNGPLFELPDTLSISGLDASAANTPYTLTYSQISIDNSGNNASDIDFPLGPGAFSFGADDTYVATGSSIVTGMLFADLNPGTYLSIAGDSADFGSVTLNIVAVPEPQTVALMFGVTVLALARVRRQRKADRQSESHA